MINDAALAMKNRMRADLRAAMKAGRASEAKVIRELVAAIDNAEAPALGPDRKAADLHQFGDGSSEVERLLLSADQVSRVLMADVEEREHAAAEMTRLNRPDRAEPLRQEIAIAKRYLG